MKVLGINGSPRRQWNTATLVGKALEGAASAGAETEKTDLYPQTFKGCVSCFSCKRKGGKTNGLCAVRDELTSILKKAPETDAIIIRSPVYYSYEIPYYADYQHRFIEKNTGKV
ncbi:MAG: flavodoxin family protein [Bacteroidales bacterium]|nr:flavodoxin family protein [Bacteroidales bacterium]